MCFQNGLKTIGGSIAFEMWGMPMLALGGSWDLVSRVIGTLIGVISNYNYCYFIYNLRY